MVSLQGLKKPKRRRTVSREGKVCPVRVRENAKPIDGGGMTSSRQNKVFWSNDSAEKPVRVE